ncbi:unnamed protein product, partial [Prorocentrum cordatum]
MADGALDLDGEDAVMDGRGWAMRRGHCKRLRADKGRESQRGRAAFARSVNRRSRGNKSADVASDRRRDRRAVLAALRAEAVGEQLAGEDGPSWLERAREERATASCADSLCGGHGDEADGASSAAWSAASGWELVEALQPRLGRSASAPATPCEVGAAEAEHHCALVPLCAGRLAALAGAWAAESRGRPRCWRWLLAVELAERTAAAAGAAVARPAAAPLRRRRQRPREERRVATPFDRLRQEFLHQHGPALRSKLGSCFGLGPENVQLAPAPVGSDPVNRFLDAKKRMTSCNMLPVYHGTDPTNFESIFKRGLLIPGKGNDLRVVNGSAHGLGIYTGMLEHPWLSMSYSKERRLLVCACLDGGASPPLKRGSGALVIFNADLVIPMFVACDPRVIPDPFSGTRRDAPIQPP